MIVYSTFSYLTLFISNSTATTLETFLAFCVDEDTLTLSHSLIHSLIPVLVSMAGSITEAPEEVQYE